MPLDWLKTPIEPGRVTGLLVRRRRAKAIELLRRRALEEQPPSAKTRLQLADLMIGAGRESEALPILLGLADELAADGFLARAVAILKRVARIAPEHPDVGVKLAALAEQQARLPVRGALFPWVKEIAAGGAEETREPMTEPNEPDPAAAASVSDTGGPEAEASSGEGPAPEEVPAAPDSRMVEVEPEADLEDVPAQQADREDGLSQRIRVALRRFLNTIPVEGPKPSEGVAARAQSALLPEADSEAADEVLLEADPIEGLFDLDSPLTAEVLAEEAPAVMAAVAEAAVEPEPTDPLEGLRAIGSPGEQPTSGPLFEDLLDLVQEVAARPTAPAESPQPSAAALAERAVATALLRGLGADELLAVMAGLELRLYDPGDIVVTEGEAGQSLFILTTGAAKVFVRNAAGHDVEVAVLREGEFFGEISALSGQRRSATVTAVQGCEILELDKPTLDAIAQRHPRVREKLEASFVARAGNPAAAAARAVKVGDRALAQQAVEVLDAYFGGSRWTPRMRLGLARILWDSGKHDEAIPVLVSLADELAHQGFPEKAIAVIKKIEQIQRRDVQSLLLAPLARGDSAPIDATPRPLPSQVDTFQHWLVRIARETLAMRQSVGDAEPDAATLSAVSAGLRTSPLLEDLTEDELVGLIRELRLVSFGAGDIILSEGEAGEDVFVLAAGRVAVHKRDATGRNVKVCSLGPGAFFGEMATLSGRPRTATITVVDRSELLALDRKALDVIASDHPRVREVLEQHFIERANASGQD
jgi:CRP-like cAMP-binding protein